MPRRLPKYCVEDVDRHGNVRIYLKRSGRPKIRLEGVPWTPAFMAAYEAAMLFGPPAPVGNPRQTSPGSWKWLCQEYLMSAEFAGHEPSTRLVKRSRLESTYEEPIRPGSKILFGEIPIAKLTEAAIAVLRDRGAHAPHGANNRLKAVRSVFRWAMRADVRKAHHNPARDVGAIPVAGDGFHTWSIDEVQGFVGRHPVGTKAHLALCLLMFGGGRRGDVVVLGRQHISDGWLRYTQNKNRKRAPSIVNVPVQPELQAAITAAASAQHLTFLVTQFGRPFTSNGFGNWFKDRCREAGLPHCAAHGLRKAAATIAAENGATEKQLMAMFGWRTPQMAAHYTRKADQKRLAGAAMHLISFSAKSHLTDTVGPAVQKA